jgi:hypothetical protein
MDSPFGGTTMKRIREFFESIAFAGMKPGGTTAANRQLKWLGPLGGPVERLLSGPVPSDPLYLTNRTLTQKLKSWSLVAIPCLLLAAGGWYALRTLNPPEAQPAPEPTAAAIAASTLPNLAKDIQLAPSTDVQVIEIKVEGNRLVGKVRNTTSREIAVTELVIDLISSYPSQIGAVNGIVEKIPALGTKEFQIPIKQRNAASALVREVISH